MQRILVLDGPRSDLMEGDLNLENCPPGKALPALLARGWRVVQLSCAGEGGLKGYAVLEQADLDDLSDETIGY